MENKEQLLNKLADLQKSIQDAQKQAEELQKQIDAPEKTNSLLERVEGNSKQDYFGVDEMNQIQVKIAFNPDPAFYKGAAFTTQEQAENYRKAFETFLELRRCEGSEPANSVYQYIIRPNADGNINQLYIATTQYKYIKLSDISPCFATEEIAKQAISTVGEENLMHMFKTFHGAL